MTTEKILLHNEICPIELMIETISPQYVDYYIKNNFWEIICNLQGKEKLNFVILILNNFLTRRILRVVYREIPKICKGNIDYKDILYDKFVDALINNSYNCIETTDYVYYFSKMTNKKCKERLLEFIKKIPVTDLSNKDCDKLIKYSKDDELNEILWNKLVNNKPTWGDLNHLYLFTKDYKEKAELKLKELYPDRFLKEHNYQQYIDNRVKNIIGDERFKEFSELRLINKKEFFDINNNYDNVIYRTDIHPNYVVLVFSKIENIRNEISEDFHLFGQEKAHSLKVIVKMLKSEFYQR
jgi:hypothetical protein